MSRQTEFNSFDLFGFRMAEFGFRVLPGSRLGSTVSPRICLVPDEEPWRLVIKLEAQNYGLEPKRMVQ